MRAGELTDHHLGAFTGERVHPVEVRRWTLAVRYIWTRISAHGPVAVDRQVEFAHGRIGERDVFRTRDVEAFAERAIPIGIRLHHLHGLDALILRPPHVDIGDRVRILAPAGVRERVLRHDAEEDAVTIVAPGERGAIGDDETLGEARGLRRIEHRRFAVLDRDVGEDDELVVPFAHLLDVAPLEHGESGAAIVPREAAVVQ